LPANAQIENKVVAIIASIEQVSPKAIRMETTFDELGIDSLDRINILFELESEFDVDIPDERGALHQFSKWNRCAAGRLFAA